jgi:hypothetical protein
VDRKSAIPGSSASAIHGLGRPLTAVLNPSPFNETFRFFWKILAVHGLARS